MPLLLVAMETCAIGGNDLVQFTCRLPISSTFAYGNACSKLSLAGTLSNCLLLYSDASEATFGTSADVLNMVVLPSGAHFQALTMNRCATWDNDHVQFMCQRPISVASLRQFVRSLSLNP